MISAEYKICKCSSLQMRQLFSQSVIIAWTESDSTIEVVVGNVFYVSFSLNGPWIQKLSLFLVDSAGLLAWIGVRRKEGRKKLHNIFRVCFHQSTHKYMKTHCNVINVTYQTNPPLDAKYVYIFYELSIIGSTSLDSYETLKSTARSAVQKTSDFSISIAPLRGSYKSILEKMKGKKKWKTFSIHSS